MIKNNLFIIFGIIILSGCSSSGHHRMYGATPISDSDRQKIVSSAEMYLGCPAGKNGKVLNAQNCPAQNLPRFQKFDCSNFTRHVYSMAGIDLNGNAETQCKNMKKRADGTPKPGDIVCFGYKNKPIKHIGIALPDGKFIHAATLQNKQVKISDLNTYKKPPYIGFVDADSYK